MKNHEDEFIRDNSDGDFPPIPPPTQAEIEEAARYSRSEALMLYGLYSSIQKFRVAASNKSSAHNRKVDTLADPLAIQALHKDLLAVEKKNARYLQAYAAAQPLGQWAMQFNGAGSILTAGLLAHIDVTIATTAGKLWKFAGLLDPEQLPWEKGMKRPYNAQLKKICFQLGDCFKRCAPSAAVERMDDAELAEALKEQAKVKGKKLDKGGVLLAVAEKRAKVAKKKDKLSLSENTYVKLYVERKRQEVQRNEQGLFQAQALKRLEKALRNRWNISPEQRKIWSEGKLQPIGLDLRAMRYAVKIFLSHLLAVGREMLGLEVVRPWIIEHGERVGLGKHTDYMPPPLWPAEG